MFILEPLVMSSITNLTLINYINNICIILHQCSIRFDMFVFGVDDFEDAFVIFNMLQL